MKIDELVTKLLAATDKRKLLWVEDGDGMFSTQLPGNTIVASRYFDDDTGEAVYGISIFKGAGGFMERGPFVDGSKADRFDDGYSMLEKLWAEARRSALNVSEALDDLNDQLDEIMKGPSK